MHWLWFVAGVETPEGVGIGSLMREVRAAYGRRLERIPPLEIGDDLLLVAPGDPDNVFEVLGEKRRPRTSLLVALRNGRVVGIGHALGQADLTAGFEILDLRC